MDLSKTVIQIEAQPLETGTSAGAFLYRFDSPFEVELIDATFGLQWFAGSHSGQY
ncbi:hypothetical protein [Mesorhizobium sp. GbtcB19]|uniref:hypothetical protein n=1 Tax=Mesorhizobium sp. GbtcB19 TaxID=2824764 RepID=UPI001C30CEA6|nr:hypothetical protein [Mesorhizobium sp. GbtcB19]